MSIRKSIAYDEIARAVDSIASQIASQHSGENALVLAAIANGGIPFCELLAESISKIGGPEVSQAIIDISFHRDDIGVNPIAKEVESTQLSQDPEESIIILVDDVIFSGRSIRAALAEINAIGRPRKVELAVLIDRGNRRLPIQPDYAGIVEATDAQEKVVAHLDTSEPEKSHIDILSA